MSYNLQARDSRLLLGALLSFSRREAIRHNSNSFSFENKHYMVYHTPA